MKTNPSLFLRKNFHRIIIAILPLLMQAWSMSAQPCAPVVSFTTVLNSPGNYSFTAVASGFTLPTLHYQWNSSNGQHGYSPVFNVTFNAPGTYAICLSVSDSNGCTAATICDSITTTFCQGCVSSLYYTQDSLDPSLYTFFDTTTYIATPSVATWIANSITSTGDSVTVVNANPGPVTVCRNVIVPGCSNSCIRFMCITATRPGIRIHSFSPDTNIVYCSTPQPITFHWYGNAYGYSSGDSVAIHVNFGDGTDTSFFVPNIPNYHGSIGSSFTHVFQNVGTYVPQLIVYSSDSIYSDTTLSSDPVWISASCGSLAGTAYRDNNLNCLHDAGDDVLPYRRVTLSNGTNSYQTYTDVNGVYSFEVPPGTPYTVSIDTFRNWNSSGYLVVCPPGGVLTVFTVPSANNDFFLACPVGFDLTASINGWGFQPGDSGLICVHPIDNRCGFPNAQVQLILDPLLTAYPDSTGSYTISGDTVTWNATPINSGNYWRYPTRCINVYVSPSATIGDTVCLTLLITPVAGDSVPSNNTITWCKAIGNSWDPNDKSAEPGGEGVNHAIRPEGKITYTIRFQNTGTAPAHHVFILDTIDANLDLNTMEIIHASHDMVPSIYGGNIYRFSFDNINLPDSNTNELLSHGYVTYRLAPRAGIANATVLTNTAAIYFDYNPAVITNTVWHTIDIFLAVHDPVVANNVASVFPNPADARLFIRLNKPARTEVCLFDLAGRVLLKKEIRESDYLDVSMLSAGMYHVQILSEGGVQKTSVVIVRE